MVGGAERWNYANGSEYFTMRYTFDETGSVIGFSTHYPNFVACYWEDYLFAKNLQGDDMVQRPAIGHGQNRHENYEVRV